MIKADSLRGKVAFVQGGSRGIGAAIVQRLAREGAAVAFTYVNSAEKAQAIAARIIAGGGKAIAIRADSASPEALQGAVRQAAGHYGALDILVNNTGVLSWGAFEELTLEEIDRALAVNVRSAFVAGQEAVRHMPAGGRIINIGSVNAERMPIAGGALYAMSKSALVGMTKGMARDLGPRGITVNNVQPGPVATDMNSPDGEVADHLRSLMAVGRYGSAEEVASFVTYLASPEAGYISGASLTIDGGFAA